MRLTATRPPAHPQHRRTAEGDPTPLHGFATGLTWRQLSPHISKNPLEPISKFQNVSPVSAPAEAQPCHPDCGCCQHSAGAAGSSGTAFLAGKAHAGCQAGAGPGAHVTRTPTTLWTSHLQSPSRKITLHVLLLLQEGFGSTVLQPRRRCQHPRASDLPQSPGGIFPLLHYRRSSHMPSVDPARSTVQGQR